MAGSVVRASLVGTNLEGAMEVSLSGPGVTARMLGPPQPGRIELVIDIAADAAPGPRAVRLGVAGRPSPDAVFHVLARSIYAGTSGIGSHLI